MEVINNLLSKQDSDPFTIEAPPPLLPLTSLNSGVESLIIRGTQAYSAQNAKNIFNNPNQTQRVHLFIGMDGKEIIQMVPFNHRAGYNWKFNNTAISLGLVNPGEIFIPEKYKNHLSHISRYDGEYLYAFGDNDNRYRVWASYKSEQLDLLFNICQVLIKHFNIKSVQTYEELGPAGLDPGPSFPKVRFYEALKTAHPNIDISLRVLDETNKEVTLHNHPKEDSPLDASGTIPPNTPIAVVDEKSGWSLIEVMKDIDNKKWLKGWIKSDAIQMQKLTPVVENDFLVTDKGRKYTFIEAAKTNYNNKDGSNHPKYLIMHFTTGTEMRQTIHTFRNPSQGVSTHLLIGRDGRVIQFVPFNKAAHHCGFSYWENQRGLNTCTIGIELDNAGYLTPSQDGQNWMRKGTIIPSERVKLARHIKDYSDRHWECFPQQQLDVAFAIAKALKEEYGLVDILGHDQINIKYRRDPGPLFEEHIKEWRNRIFTREDADTVKYETLEPVNGGGVIMYLDHLGKKPVINHPLVPGIHLKHGRVIHVIEKHGIWWQIRVSGRHRSIGWVRSVDIIELPKVTKINKENTPFFQVLTTSNAGPPPTEHPNSPLPPGKELRVQKFEGGMALIVTTVTRNETERIIEGWVREVDIKKT
jgi:N-acetylmuramoyl-L-alanine amidase